jgi:hypothetical protein
MQRTLPESKNTFLKKSSLPLTTTMAINPVRIDYLTVCGFIHSRNKFCDQINVLYNPAKNLFSAGLMNENTLKITKLQHWIYSVLAGRKLLR